MNRNTVIVTGIGIAAETGMKDIREISIFFY